jgi:hypothetical protein
MVNALAGAIFFLLEYRNLHTLIFSLTKPIRYCDEKYDMITYPFYKMLKVALYEGFDYLLSPSCLRTIPDFNARTLTKRCR